MTIDAKQQYAMLQKKNREALSYDNLLPYTENKQGWTIPKEQLFKEFSKEKPSQFIQRTLEEKGHGCTKAWTATDVKKPSQFVLNLRFASESKASECKEDCKENPRTSKDKKTLTLNQKVIPIILEKLGIVHYGSTNPIPILQALHQEHKQQMKLNTSVKFFSAIEIEKLTTVTTREDTTNKSSRNRG